MRRACHCCRGARTTSEVKERGLGTPLLGLAPDPSRKFRSRSQITAPRRSRRGQWNRWRASERQEDAAEHYQH
jgi:hypothetical protein